MIIRSVQRHIHKHIHRQFALCQTRSRSFHFQPTIDADSPTPAEIAPLLDEYATHPPRPLTLSTLLSFAHPLTPQSVLDSVGYVLSEIPRMFVWRVRALEGLPFIVGMNPFIAKTLDAHRRSFKLLATYPSVKNLEDNAKFTVQLEALVQAHANDIPIMAKGFQECSKYLTPAEISSFLDAAIRNRIAVRLLAEQHIAISRDVQYSIPQPSSHHSSNDSGVPEHLGVVDMQCSPAEMIHMCASFVSELCEATLGAAPEVIIDGDVDATFAYVPVHLEYILTEILKNAFRASVERHQSQSRSSIATRMSSEPPPIRITIAPPPPPSALPSSPMSSATSTIDNSSPSISFHPHPALLALRIRDEGGGVAPANVPHIFSYSFTTARASASADCEIEEDGGPYAAQAIGGMAGLFSNSMHTPSHSKSRNSNGVVLKPAKTSGGAGLFGDLVARGSGISSGMGTIAGLGYGLPMSRLYAMYFGGNLEFVSLDGWGSDVFVKLRCLDRDEAGDIKI